jgi:periplasmic copper chaperone A
VSNHRVTRALAVAAVAFVAAAPMAAAHVTVNPREAPKGGYAALAFRVPNERDDSGTTALEVNMPEDHPVASVRVKPKPGWSYEVEHRTLDEPLDSHGNEITEVVSKITWTGGEIQPDEYEEFEVSMGRLPEDADQMVFPSLQTYASGEVVRWIDDPAEDGEDEPEHPAPVLTLVDADGGHGGDEAAGGDGDGDVDGESASGLTVENTASQSDVDSASTLATVALVAALLGLAAAAFAVVKGRRA